MTTQKSVNLIERMTTGLEAARRAAENANRLGEEKTAQNLYNEMKAGAEALVSILNQEGHEAIRVSQESMIFLIQWAKLDEDDFIGFNIEEAE